MIKMIKEICGDKMKVLYRVKIPYLMEERYEEELEIVSRMDNMDEFCAYGVLSRRSSKGSYTMLPSGIAAGSYLLYLMNPDCPNPLQSHYYCPRCGFFKLGPKNVFGMDLPVKNCPDCGGIIMADGFDLDLDYIFGPDRCRKVGIEMMVKETFISSENYWERYRQLHNHRKTCLSYAEECTVDSGCGYQYREEIYHELIKNYEMEKQKAFNLMELIRSGKLYHKDELKEVGETYNLTEEQLAPYTKIGYVSALANAIVRVLPAMRSSDQNIFNINDEEF